MNRETFITDSIYHIYNRGSDKRVTFLDADDHQRFVNGLIEYNDANPARDPRVQVAMPRLKLVEILCYCLMPNHFHLMIRQTRDGGITQFMRKIGTGYTMYFNKRYDRSGVLFQGIFKSVLVDQENYLRYLPHYIHLNPTQIGFDASRLGEYRWSSYPEYTGGGAHIADTRFLQEIYKPERYDEALADWIRERGDQSIASVALD